ncbi:MAG TPA: hypothetical protein ENG81_01050 [Candidatus Bathyarchaeota archaeon]|nr:hypothetical protein [Candidatus Bathyarchaeota archaeon]
MKISKQYIAGFVDGEGYFGLIKKSSKVCTRGYYYTPVLKIAQACKNDGVLRAIKEFIGYGNLEFRKSLKPNISDSSSLEFRGMKRVVPIIDKLLPYLIVKKKQAELLKEFSKIKIGRTGYSYDIETDRKRTEIYHKVRFLNKRGLAETE